MMLCPARVADKSKPTPDSRSAHRHISRGWNSLEVIAGSPAHAKSAVIQEIDPGVQKNKKLIDKS